VKYVFSDKSLYVKDVRYAATKLRKWCVRNGISTSNCARNGYVRPRACELLAVLHDCIVSSWVTSHSECRRSFKYLLFTKLHNWKTKQPAHQGCRPPQNVRFVRLLEQKHLYLLQSTY